MIVLERRWSDFSTRRYQIVSSCSVLVDAPIEATSTVESGGPEAVQRVQRGRVIKSHRRRREKWDLGGSPLRTVWRVFCVYRLPRSSLFKEFVTNIISP